MVPEKRRSEMIYFRATPKVRAVIDQIIKETDGQSISKYIETVVLRELKILGKI